MESNNRQKKRVTFLLKSIVLLAILLTQSGCMGQMEINELAIVTAVGIDAGSEPGSVRITAQIVRPADARGQTGAPSGGTGEPIYSIQAEGQTFFQAIRNLARFSSRKVYWAQNFIIVVNDRYAKQGLNQMIDFFTRNHELRMNTWVAVTPDNAGQVVSTITGLEVIPGSSLDKLFRYNEIVGEAARSNMMRLQESYLNNTSEPVLAKLQLRERGISNKKPAEFGSLDQVELSGLAVFKKDKMLGYLTPRESRAALYFIEKVQSGTVVLPCADDPKKNLTLELRGQNFKVTPKLNDDMPQFEASLKSVADLVENGCSQSLQEMRPEWEAAMAAQLKEDFESMLNKSQNRYKSDFLKLGESFENRFPYEWRSIGPKWQEEYPKIKVSVDVSASIKSPVLMIRSTKSEKDKEDER